VGTSPGRDRVGQWKHRQSVPQRGSALGFSKKALLDLLCEDQEQGPTPVTGLSNRKASERVGAIPRISPAVQGRSGLITSSMLHTCSLPHRSTLQSREGQPRFVRSIPGKPGKISRSPSGLDFLRPRRASKSKFALSRVGVGVRQRFATNDNPPPPSLLPEINPVPRPGRVRAGNGRAGQSRSQSTAFAWPHSVLDNWAAAALEIA
jgi:hypothetical protein